MRKCNALLLAMAIGVILGHTFDNATREAAAGPGPSCATENGDVNGDGAPDIGDAVYLLNFLFSSGPAPAPLCPTGTAGLPDTGQTTCYDEFGNIVDCATGPCAGQDGAYDTGCPPAGRFLDNGDGTVTDLCTGLMWQQDTADTNGDGVVDDFDPVPWCTALEYCEGLELAGHTDWRLPNVRELQSIVDYEIAWPGPAIDPVFDAFPSTQYWSSTSFAESPQYGRRVGFGGGNVGVDLKGTLHHIRAVRNGP